MRKIWPLVVTLFFVVPAVLPAQEKKPITVATEKVELVKDVVFGKGGQRDLKMHLIRPREAAKEPMPVLVWVHGGGWVGGDKDSGIGMLTPYAERGYFCASIQYRFSNEAVFPAQIEDCKCAIRFLRAKAKEYSINPDRIGVAGASAGGHLVALLGTTASVKALEGDGGWSEFPSNVQAVCDFCGPTDLPLCVKTSKGGGGLVEKLIGGDVAGHKKTADLASPVLHVTKDAAPTLLIHGDQDTLVPLEQAQVFETALKKAGVPVTLYVARGQGHGLGGPEVNRVVREFFDRTLRGAK